MVPVRSQNLIRWSQHEAFAISPVPRDRAPHLASALIELSGTTGSLQRRGEDRLCENSQDQRERWGESLPGVAPIASPPSARPPKAHPESTGMATGISLNTRSSKAPVPLVPKRLDRVDAGERHADRLTTGVVGRGRRSQEAAPRSNAASVKVPVPIGTVSDVSDTKPEWPHA